MQIARGVLSAEQAAPGILASGTVTLGLQATPRFVRSARRYRPANRRSAATTRRKHHSKKQTPTLAHVRTAARDDWLAASVHAEASVAYRMRVVCP